MRLTLLIPELIWPEPADQLTLGNLPAPGFAWLDGHAPCLRSTPLPYEKVLLDLFGLGEGGTAGGTAGGAANFRRLGEFGEFGAVADNQHWLCADPVHLRFHHERIVLADAGAFDIDAAEAEALVGALNAEFADIGVFHAATPRRWYLRLHAAVDHVAEPLSAVAGRRMDSELQGKTSPLHRWLNEVQMFLHLHPVNATRASQGKPAINSLWLWGAASGSAGSHAGKGGESSNGSQLTASKHASAPVSGPAGTRPDAVFSNDPLAIGLGRASAADVHARPETPESVLASGAQAPLVVLDQLLPTVLYEDPEGWRRGFAELDSRWFEPLRGQLGKSVKNLTIVAPGIYGRLEWTLTGSERWKFWKKGRSPADIAQAFAAKPLEGNSA